MFVPSLAFESASALDTTTNMLCICYLLASLIYREESSLKYSKQQSPHISVMPFNMDHPHSTFILRVLSF